MKYLISVVLLFTLLSCSDDDDLNIENFDTSTEGVTNSNNNLSEKELQDLLNNNLERNLALDIKLSKETESAFIQAGYGGSQVRVYLTKDKRNNNTYYEYEIDGDAYISEDDLMNYSNNITSRQFRTDN